MAAEETTGGNLRVDRPPIESIQFGCKSADTKLFLLSAEKTGIEIVFTYMIYMNTTKETLINYVETNVLTPVTSSRTASLANRRRAQTDGMRIRQLPARSVALYITHAAACDTPRREASNSEMERDGFISYRQLLPAMREHFRDMWP
jgi:hypothetical protein